MPPPARVRQSAVDACPGALRLHAAADGPLARVRLPAGMLTGAQLALLASLATAAGDGRLELTSRANVQLRGLTRADPAVLEARLAAAGLLPSPTHETVRNIAASPLADDRIRALVRALDDALCADPELAALPGRFLFAIGAVTLDADVAAVPDGPAFTIQLAGLDTGLHVPDDRVVPALLLAAHAFLAERSGDRPAWRLREIPDGPALVARRLGSSLVEAPPAAPAPDAPIGLVTQDDGRFAVGALVPLGCLDAVHVDALAAAARLVVTPRRGIVVRDLSEEDARRWLRDLADAGLEVTAGSRWSGVTTCAGKPGCAKALADVRADADATTRHVDGLAVHWVGCARGCGSPSGAHVRVEATADGYLVNGVAATRDELAESVAGARRG
nr:precorrin-3B synthase [uncultured Actinoplanes sp.]